jgi:hypothetical protein
MRHIQLNMTSSLKHFSSQIEKALELKDFSFLFDLFSNKGFTFTELLIFYKKNGKIFTSIEYWRSRLPHFYLELILDSGIKVSFLQAYFSSNKFCNPELDKHLLIIAKQDYIKHFKLWSALDHENFMTSIREIAQTDPEIERFVKEIVIINKAQSRIAEEQKVDEIYFSQFSISEILLAFTLYYYDFKQDPQIAGNKSLQTKIEATLIEELNTLISLFKDKSNLSIEFSNNEELQKQFQRNEAPHHILGKKGIDVPIESKFQFLYNLIERLIDRNRRKGQIQLYLSGYSDFDTVILNPAPLKTNNSYRTFSINDIKSVPEEFYFSKLRIDSLQKIQPLKTDITTSIEAFKFYGVPESVGKNAQIDQPITV